MNKLNQNGFTLMELIVVIVLIGIMLLFAVPRFNTSLTINDKNKFSRWMIMQVKSLREKSFQERSLYTLHIDISVGKFWVTHEAPAEEEKPEDETGFAEEVKSAFAEEEAPKTYELPDDLVLLDVEFPEKGIISMGEVVINFYPKGYSDRAIIHIADEGDLKRYSYRIESFLPRVKMVDEYVEYGS